MKALFICFLVFIMVMLNQNTLADDIHISFDKLPKPDRNAYERFKKTAERNGPPNKGREEANKYSRGCSHLKRCRD